jgi:hypothetical protein
VSDDGASEDIEHHSVDKETGTVGFQMQFSGMVDNPMPLRGFPFDEDSLLFRFEGDRLRDGRTASAADFVLKPADVFFEFLTDPHGGPHDTPGPAIFRLLGTHHRAFVENKLNVSFITCGIAFERKVRMYFVKVKPPLPPLTAAVRCCLTLLATPLSAATKVVFLLWMITTMALAAFLLGPNELHQRMSMLQTMFLAAAATLYMVGAEVPKTETLNRLDMCILSTMFVLFASAVESMIIYRIYRNVPGGFREVVVSPTILEEAEAFDSVFGVVLSAAFILHQLALFLPPALRKCRRSKSRIPPHVGHNETWTHWLEGKVV